MKFTMCHICRLQKTNFGVNKYDWLLGIECGKKVRNDVRNDSSIHTQCAVIT